jgi:hypothetical protein
MPDGEPTGPAAEQPTSVPRRRPFRFWPLAILGVAVVLGLLVGITLGVRGEPLLGGATQTYQLARPTIVLERAPSPPAIASSPVPASTTAPIAEATLVPSEFDEYVVAPGDTMRSIAQQAYGDPDLWPKIYAANREQVGADPNSLQVGEHLKIPR